MHPISPVTFPVMTQQKLWKQGDIQKDFFEHNFLKEE